MRLVGEGEHADPMHRPLVDGDLILRRPRAGDAEARFTLGQDPAIIRLFGVDPTTLPPWSREAAFDWVSRVQHHIPAWIIEQDGQLLGDARLHSLSHEAGSAALAIGLIDSARLNKGFGRRAIGLILDFAFDTLKLHRVGLRCLEVNQRAIRCYEACGFRREGIAREAVRMGGQWYDDVLMAKLAQDHRRG